MTSNFFVLVLSTLVVFGSASQAQAQTCNSTFRSVFSLFGFNQADWRAGSTNRSDEAVDLSKDSEKVLKQYRDAVNDAVYIESSTLGIEIEVHKNASLTTVRPPGDYGSRTFPKYAVEGLTDGKVGIVLGLPVSGHTGPENAALWAKTDKYNVRIEKEVDGRYVDHRKITQQQSQDTTTFHELILEMEKGVNYKLSYWRDGSAGPGGYPEGRFIELIWNGN